MLFAIDTSTLIILQKLGWLDLCRQSGNKFIWPPGVTQELNAQRSKNKEIFDLLASGTFTESETNRPLSIEGISITDAGVISLAIERQAAVLSEDVLLRDKAAKIGCPANSLASFCVLIYQGGLSTKDECLARLKKLNDRKFLSTPEYRQFLQGLLP